MNEVLLCVRCGVPISDHETRPCADCGVSVRDHNDPSYTDDWVCYHCHSLRDGRDPKEALNHLSEMIIMGWLIERETT